MTTKLSFVATPAQVFAATRSHWTDLGLDAAPIDALEATLSVSGSLAYARAGSVELWGHTNDNPPLVDLYVSDADAHLWRSPLASAETMVVHATRGDLTVPVLEGAGLPRPLTPRYVTAGHVLPVEAPNGDFPTPDAWVQRTPGLQPASEVPQIGWIERIGDDRYVCEAAQSNVGGVMVNYFAPDALNGGWRRVAAPGGGLDPWSAGTYQLDAEVVYEPDSTEWRNRRPNNNQAFAPPVAASGWMQIGPGAGPFPWKNVGNEGVPLGWLNTRNGRLWRSLIAANFWEPSAAVPSLWTDEGPI